MEFQSWKDSWVALKFIFILLIRKLRIIENKQPVQAHGDRIKQSKDKILKTLSLVKLIVVPQHMK